MYLITPLRRNPARSPGRSPEEFIRTGSRHARHRDVSFHEEDQ
ncbi:hypothetical protein Pd630_LPD04775 [Rhodococcus opacus PD630]|nr:hypothetical protein Pd630_LPD04775 [Rhodococcus opacus PD630]